MLKKAPHWTDLYYRMVEHYFWRPQAIGRKSDPAKPARPWDFWQKKLKSQETPLNHILDLLFHIAPDPLLNRIASQLLGRDVSGLELVEPADGVLDGNIVQPDIILSNSAELVFVEMKVDSVSSLDQFAKYAVAACCIAQHVPDIRKVDLVILSRYQNHELIWRNAKRLALKDERALRAAAVRGIEGDESVWSERGVQKFMRTFPMMIPALRQQIVSMGLHLVDYSRLDQALQDYASEEQTLARLIQGVRAEFKRRELIE